MEFAGVGKTLQDRVVPGWLEQLEEGAKDFVQKWIGVSDVEVERIERATKMELGLIIQRAAPVTFEPLGERPAEDVAQGVKVEMKIERHAVIQAEVIVVDRALMHERDAERNRLSLLSPDKKTDAIRHSTAEFAEIFLRQPLELHRRTFVDLEVEGINFVHERRQVGHHFDVDR